MSESEVINKPKIEPKEKTAHPSMYVVLLHNDPMTPRQFVVIALRKCFGKVEKEAQAIMIEAHEEGKAAVNKYTREIAEMKAQKANDYSAENGYVLLFTAEKE